jgi:hypothetical protein
MRSIDCPNIEAGPMSQTHGSLERVLHRQNQRIQKVIEQTRSGNMYGLVSSTSNEYGLVTLASNEWEAELHDLLGRPSDTNYSPSDARLPQWPGSLSPHALAALAAQASSNDEPRSWNEAMDSIDAKQWQAAAEDEMRSLEKAKVFHLVPRSSTRGRVVTSKWVFKIKRLADGSIDRYKARLVARDFTQQAGIDYDETFAPVAKFQWIRTILALAAMNDLELHQMDVKTAFLYGSLEETVYMEQPQGFERGMDMVWKLDRSLYGLKQAPRAWYRTLDSSLKELGFRTTPSTFEALEMI